MKRKLDFVTNSSSCSYLVYIPGDFDINKAVEENKDLIDKELSKEWISEQFTKKDFVFEILQNHLTLINQGEISAYQYEPYIVLSNIYTNNGLMIDSLESCGENEDSIMININCLTYKNKIKKIKDNKNEKKT